MKELYIMNEEKYTQISFAGEPNNAYLVTVKNDKGKSVFNQALVFDELLTTIVIPTKYMRAGIYSLILRSAKAIHRTKILIKRANRKRR